MMIIIIIIIITIIITVLIHILQSLDAFTYQTLEKSLTWNCYWVPGTWMRWMWFWRHISFQMLMNVWWCTRSVGRMASVSTSWDRTSASASEATRLYRGFAKVRTHPRPQALWGREKSLGTRMGKDNVINSSEYKGSQLWDAKCKYII